MRTKHMLHLNVHHHRIQLLQLVSTLLQ